MEQLDDLLRRVAATEGATDLHLKAGSPPRVRARGALDPLLGEPVLDKATVEAIAGHVLPASACATFDQRNEAECAYSVDGVGRFRVAIYRQRGSVAMIFRRLQTQAASVAELGLPMALRTLARTERGLVLVGGPAGSGRTTTIAAMVDHLNHTRSCHIVTIEDPVEVLHRDRMAAISQREVGRDVPTTEAGIVAALRHDPDVIVVGHLEHAPAVHAAVAAAESGVLVIAGTTGSDVADCLRRLVASCAPDVHQQMRLAIVGALNGVTCQRLVPAVAGGRVAAVEVMVTTGAAQVALVTADDDGLRTELATGTNGMQTLDQALVSLVEGGTIDLRGAMAATTNWQVLRHLLEDRGRLPGREPAPGPGMQTAPIR